MAKWFSNQLRGTWIHSSGAGTDIGTRLATAALEENGIAVQMDNIALSVTIFFRQFSTI